MFAFSLPGKHHYQPRLGEAQLKSEDHMDTDSTANQLRLALLAVGPDDEVYIVESGRFKLFYKGCGNCGGHIILLKRDALLLVADRAGDISEISDAFSGGRIARHAAPDEIADLLEQLASHLDLSKPAATGHDVVLRPHPEGEGFEAALYLDGRRTIAPSVTVNRYGDLVNAVAVWEEAGCVIPPTAMPRIRARFRRSCKDRPEV